MDPPALEDGLLIASLAGEADPPVHEHLARCPFCRQRRDRLAGQIDRLKSRLYRVECPSPKVLSQFHQNQLAGDRAEEVRRHLEHCPHCAGEAALLQRRAGSGPGRQPFAGLENALEESAGALLEGARLLVARLVGGPGLSSGLMPVRGERAGPQRYEAEGLEISVDSQPDDREPGLRQVIGSLLGADGEGWSVTFWAGGESEAAVAGVDELGFFAMRGLRPGRYGLSVRSPDGALEVRVPNVSI